MPESRVRISLAVKSKYQTEGEVRWGEASGCNFTIGEIEKNRGVMIIGKTENGSATVVEFSDTDEPKYIEIPPDTEERTFRYPTSNEDEVGIVVFNKRNGE